MKKGLFDLVEGKWNPSLEAYVKTATHKTNVPYAICKDEQLKREGNGVVTRASSVRYKIVPNGELQYSNTFILTKKAKSERDERVKDFWHNLEKWERTELAKIGLRPVD